MPPDLRMMPLDLWFLFWPLLCSILLASYWKTHMQTQPKGITLILVFLIFAGIISWYFGFKDYRQEDTVNIHSFPKNLVGWESEELTISEEEYAILETKNAFARRYKKEGKEVDLLIVYSQTNRKVSHPPELCYTGSGLTILNKHDVRITIPSSQKVLIAKELLLEKGNFKELSIYWFKGGNTFTSNYWKQQTLVAFNSLLNKPASSALIRLSTVITNDKNSIPFSEETLQEFAQIITPALLQYLP